MPPSGTAPSSPPQPSVPSNVHATRNYSILGLLAAAVVLGGLAVVAYFFSPATQPEREGPLTVGIIQNVKHLDQVIDGFKQGLTELGYEEGKDIVYEYNSADGDVEKAKGFARGYIANDVDLLLVVTSPIVAPVWQVVQESGKDIPIVFTNGVGLVGDFLDSYQSSGKNVTGVIPDDIEVTVKKLEFLKKIDPTAKKVGVFIGTSPHTAAADLALEALLEQAPGLGFEMVVYEIPAPAPQSPSVMQKIADGIKPGDIDAIVTIPDVVSNFQDNPKILLELSKRVKAPILFLTVPRVFEGGLLSYSQDYIVFGKQASAQADKIFKGTPAIEIPIELSKKNLLIINLKTAKELGLTIPDELIYAADQVIPAE